MREHELFQSHIPIKKEGQTVGYRETPYCTIIAGGESVTIKGGQFYSSGGEPIDLDAVSELVWNQVERMTEECRSSLGIDMKLRPVAEIEAAPKGKSKVDPSLAKKD